MGKKRHKYEDYVDLGAGYDENDSFIDNTDAVCNILNIIMLFNVYFIVFVHHLIILVRRNCTRRDDYSTWRLLHQLWTS